MNLEPKCNTEYQITTSRYGQQNDNTLVAFFGRVNYSFDNKYYLQAIVRHEGSSRFGANHKWGTFPALSAGWTISEEGFMYDVDAIDELKLRVGYGVTGNQGILTISR